MTDGIIVNFHEHPSPRVSKTNADLGIDCSVLLPVGADAAALALSMSQSEPGAFVPFAWIDPRQDLTQQAQRLRVSAQQHGIRGVKFQPMDQHWCADDRRLYPIYKVCSALGLVTTWHAGVVSLGFKYELGVPMLARYTDPMPLDQVAFDFPDLAICIAHMGGNYYHTALVLAEKHENVYLDTAFLTFFCPRMMPPVSPTALIAHAARFVGAGKILYGSEGLSPDAVRQTDLPEEQQNQILGRNALSLLGLSLQR